MQKPAYILYLTILLLSIIMFGAMHTYVYTLMILGVLLAALLLVFSGIQKDYRSGAYTFRIQKTGLNLFFVVILGLLVFQLVPMPSWVLEMLSPEAWVVWQKSLPAAAVVDGQIPGGWHTLSVYGYPVRMSLVRWVVYGFFFFGLVQVLNTRKRITFLVYWILCIGCFEALYGLMQAYSMDPHVLWAKSVSGKKSASGTYINRNHFAAFMAMGMVLAAGFSAALSDMKQDRGSGRRRKPTLRSRLSAVFVGDEKIQKRLLVLFAGVVMGVGLVFSASRGGIVSGVLGLLCMGLFLIFRKDYKRKGMVFLVLFLLVGAYSLDVGIEYVVSRFEKIGAGMEKRTRYSKEAMRVFGDFPVAGVGVGNFKYVYPRYQPEEDKKIFIRFAHNDWAQYLLEAGIVGMVLLLGGVALYLITVIRLWRRRHDPFAVCLGIVPVPVMAVLGIHAFSEFNLHIPANFLVLVTIMAIGYAALHLECHHRRDVMAYRYYELPLRYRGGVVLVLILGLIGWTGYWSVRHFMGEVYCHTVPNSTLNRDLHPPLGELVAAVGWDPGNAAYWYGLGSIDEKIRGLEGEKIRGLVGKGKREALERAVELNPFEARYHLRLGWEYAHLWKEKDYHTKWLPAADISMDRAAYFAGVKNPHLHQELGNYWTMRSRTVLPNNSIYHEAWARACWHYRKAQSLERGGVLKRMKKEIREYVWRFYPDDQYLEQVLN